MRRDVAHGIAFSGTARGVTSRAGRGLRSSFGRHRLQPSRLLGLLGLLGLPNRIPLLLLLLLLWRRRRRLGGTRQLGKVLLKVKLGAVAACQIVQLALQHRL